MSKITKKEFIENQKEYAKRIKAPMFLPPHGWCYSCHSDIVNELIKRGHEGNEKLITGCPVCHTSFVA